MTIEVCVCVRPSQARASSTARLTRAVLGQGAATVLVGADRKPLASPGQGHGIPKLSILVQRAGHRHPGEEGHGVGLRVEGPAVHGTVDAGLHVHVARGAYTGKAGGGGDGVSISDMHVLVWY